MTNFNEDDKTISIPDFMDDKDTDSSVDMSIFNLPDEELYDDVPKKSDKKKTEKKKSNSTIVLCLVVIGVLMAALTVVSIYAVQQHNAYAKDHDKITQLEAANKDANAKVNELQNQLDTLQAQIKEKETSGTTSDPNSKYKSGTKLYITEEGHEYAIRKQAKLDSEKGEVKYWGESIVLLEDGIVDADGNYWGKVEGGYFPLEYNGEVFASSEKQ